MSQFFIDSNSIPGSSINTLSAENGAATPPSGNNFNFSGSLAGGSTANGAVLFNTSAAGEMNAVVQTDSSTIFINASNQLQAISGLTWNVQAADLTAVKGHGYFANSATPGPIGLIVTLPAISSVGDTFKVYAFTSNGWTIAQNAAQFIQVANQTTTVGVLGSLVSTKTGDVVELVCSVANTQWEAVSFAGNIIIN